MHHHLEFTINVYSHTMLSPIGGGLLQPKHPRKPLRKLLMRGPMPPSQQAKPPKPRRGQV